MFARVTTVFAVREQALVVPEEAIVPQGGRQFVIKVVDASAAPRSAEQPAAREARLVSLRQEVKLGVRQLGMVEIVDGLQEGETVVVAGQQRLQRDGTPLRIVELGRPPSPQGAASGPADAASAPAGRASGAMPDASLAAAGN
jgi:membrane fusion protein (multidrug efflux system)